MKDLIERQAAIEAIGKTADELYKNIKKGATFPQRQWFDGMAHAQSILENLPSAQSEIIHCRECKWHRFDKDNIPYCYNIDYGYGWKDDDFCSRAERREEGE